MRGRSILIGALLLALAVLFVAAPVWLLQRLFAGPIQTQAANEVLEAIAPEGLREVDRGAQGNGGYTLDRRYRGPDVDLSDIFDIPEGYIPLDQHNILDDTHWDYVGMWGGPSPKGDGDCVIELAKARSEFGPGHLYKAQVSCLALDVPGV